MHIGAKIHFPHSLTNRFLSDDSHHKLALVVSGAMRSGLWRLGEEEFLGSDVHAKSSGAVKCGDDSGVKIKLTYVTWYHH